MAKPTIVLRTDLHEHPAVKAWRQLQPSACDPEEIGILKQKHKSGVYRLAGLGPGRTSVIAKRGVQETAWIERTIYEAILPTLPVSAVQCYGYVEEPASGARWLFLEDAGAMRYSPRLPAHREAATRWLALLHTTSADRTSAVTLPDRGPAYYLERLRSARDRITPFCAHPSLSVDDLKALKQIVLLCDTLEARWSQIEWFCAFMPCALVHGDFRVKNAHVRHTSAGVEILSVDWETAGWGVPAIDVAAADVHAYWRAVQRSWPQIGVEHVEQIARIGNIFQWLAAIDWESTRLHPKWMGKPLCRIKPCETELASAIEAVSWRF